MTNLSPALQAALAAIPADLRPEVELSLRVPQVGPHHQEGPFMGSHLELVLKALQRAVDGSNFPSDLPASARELMQDAAVKYAAAAAGYVLLHDLDKANCLTLVRGDAKQAVSWAEWTGMFPDGDGEALTALCLAEGITQISYYQNLPDGTRTHGRVTAARLAGRADVDPVVVKAIETHEIAFQFGERGGINLPLFRKVFGDWSDDELGFALLVNFADQRGSLSATGQPDVSDFLLLARTYDAWVWYQQVEVACEQALQTERLDVAKVRKALDLLFKANDALQDETVEQAISRIKRECILPTFSVERLEAELAPVVANGLIDESLKNELIVALIATGAVPSDMGKRLGRANKPVREAIARAAN